MCLCRTVPGPGSLKWRGSEVCELFGDSKGNVGGGAAEREPGGDSARRASGNGEAQPSSSTKASSPVYKDASARTLGPIRPEERQSFVAHLRHAMPYIQGHRGKTFVLVMPGGVRFLP